ncbi:MAG: superoxide dismutase [Actinomycetota bacterium]
MRHRKLARVSIVTAAALSLGIAGSAARADRTLPERIPLPDGSQPEGLAISNGGTFYTGSIADGTVYAGDVDTGAVRVFAPGAPGRSAAGIEVRGGLVWVAGGETGMAWVYRRNGRLIRTYDFDPGGFLNDVVVTRRAAFITDSVEPFLYRVPIRDDGLPAGRGKVESRPLVGDIAYEAGFNANGIDVDRGGARFVMVQSNTGELFEVRPSGRTRRVDLGGETVESGDGVLLRGTVVFVVQNFLNQVAKVRLSEDFRTGRVLSVTTDPDFDVPTSVDDFGRALYLVNARFTTPPTPATEYWIAPIPRP